MIKFGRKILTATFLLCFLPSMLFAAENSRTGVVTTTPEIDTSAYSDGDLIGELQTLANATSPTVFGGIIAQVVITDKDAESTNIDVVYFDTNPSATTFTDNAAFDVADADLTKIICVVAITTHKLFADNGISEAQNVNCPFRASSSTIYAAFVAREAVTYTSASDLSLRTGILQD